MQRTEREVTDKGDRSAFSKVEDVMAGIVAVGETGDHLRHDFVAFAVGINDPELNQRLPSIGREMFEGLSDEVVH